MRHYLFGSALALAPTARSLGMFEAPGVPLLVATSGLSLACLADLGSTVGAVALAPVAAAANQYLLAAARTQEQSARGKIRDEHSRKPRACWTDSSMGATIKPHPSLTRCRAQRSDQTCLWDRRCARLLRYGLITAHWASTLGGASGGLAGAY